MIRKMIDRQTAHPRFYILLALAVVFFMLLQHTAFAHMQTILVIPKGERTQFWQWVKEGAAQAGKERGVHVAFRGPRAEHDYKAQGRLIETGIADQVDAIVLAPSHTLFTVPMLEDAVRQGVKVVIIDSDMEFENRVSFVASDNYLAGTQAADHLLSILKPGGSILMLRFKLDNASTLAREKGFEDFVSSITDPPNLIDAGYSGTSVGAAFHKTIMMLHANPEVDAIFSPAEAPTLGVLRALEEMGLAGRVQLVGFDYTQDIQQALDEGKMHGTVIQSPYQIGYQGVMAACDALEGKPVKSRIVTETKVVTTRDSNR